MHWSTLIRFDGLTIRDEDVRVQYGDLVSIKEPGRRSFVGTVYSQYRAKGPRSERIICVNTPSGAGIGFRVRYVTHARVTRGAKKTKSKS